MNHVWFCNKLNSHSLLPLDRIVELSLRTNAIWKRFNQDQRNDSEDSTNKLKSKRCEPAAIKAKERDFGV